MTGKENLADEFMQSMEEMLAYLEGNPVPGTRVHQREPKPNPVISARQKLGLTQVDFARVLGVSVSALRKWEQDKRMPGGAVRVLLRLIESHPDIVKSALIMPSDPAGQPLKAAE